jgi:hypothetical protein
VRWVRRLIGQGEKPSHVALYDISAGRCLADINLEPHGINMVCGIFPANVTGARRRSSAGMTGGITARGASRSSAF